MIGCLSLTSGRRWGCFLCCVLGAACSPARPDLGSFDESSRGTEDVDPVTEEGGDSIFVPGTGPTSPTGGASSSTPMATAVTAGADNQEQALAVSAGGEGADAPDLAEPSGANTEIPSDDTTETEQPVDDTSVEAFGTNSSSGGEGGGSNGALDTIETEDEDVTEDDANDAITEDDANDVDDAITEDVDDTVTEDVADDVDDTITEDDAITDTITEDVDDTITEDVDDTAIEDVADVDDTVTEDEDEICGDDNTTANEQCDDGNQVDGDGCSATCENEVCGDGNTTANEQCDDGNQSNNDGCSSTCKNEVCGDGIVQTPREECEDLNTVDTDVCRNGCMHAASLNSLSSSCEFTNQITQTVCMVATANWCAQYGHSPIAGMVTGVKEDADDQYTVGCIIGFERNVVPTSQLDQCPGGRQQSPACLDQINTACVDLGYARGFYLGLGSAPDTYAVACDDGTTKTESVPGCNGIEDTNPVPVTCADALSAKCGNNKGGMIQTRAQSDEVTYTCIDLSLTGSVRQF